MSAILELFRGSGALYGGNAAFIEDLYERYLQDPESVDLAWRHRFDAMRQAPANEAAPSQPDAIEVAHGPVRENFVRLARESRLRARSRTTEHLEPAAAEKQTAVLRLINAYRYRGHQVADTDPIQLREKPKISDLDPAYHNLTPDDMDSRLPHRVPVRPGSDAPAGRTGPAGADSLRVRGFRVHAHH